MFGLAPFPGNRYLSLHKKHNRSILRYLFKRKYPQPICLVKSVRIIAMSESQLVLIPVDGSDHSERAFEFYLRFMHKPEYTVGILHVHEAPSNTIIRIPLGSDITEEAIEKIVRAQWQKVDDLIDKYKKKCEQAEVKYSVLIETKGKPGEVICKLVKEKNALMVVMGSRGLGTIRRTILGSVSQYCIDHAHIPVTVVPPPT